LLLHQNCSTAIEAGMLSVPAVSLEWFNTPALRLGVACDVSRPAGSYEVLDAFVGQTIAEQAIKDSSEQRNFLNNVISSFYLAIDGRAAERVGDAISRPWEIRCAPPTGPQPVDCPCGAAPPPSSGKALAITGR
jgi:hypothetical protein